MSNPRRGRHYRVAQKEVETKQALENAYVGSNVINTKYVALAFAFVMLVFLKGLFIGHYLGNDK